MITVTWEQLSSLQPFLQQVGQTSPSPPPDAGGQRTSSSSSSSSSASSESSQSSEGPQLLRERERLETTAVEQTDSSQEGPELRPSLSRSSLRLHELVLLGERVGERDRERETGDDSVASRERRGRPVLLTFHHLMARPRGVAVTAGGAAANLGGVAESVVGGAEEGEEADPASPQLVDDSTERADGLTLDSPGHAHHLDEAGFELGL